MKRLAIGGVGVFAAEAIPSVEEALAIIEAVDTLSGAMCWINFRCPDKTHIASGEPLDDAFKKLSKHPGNKNFEKSNLNCIVLYYIWT
jgi:homocysteine S-methyltransferase